jgi:hypothetical protein
MNLFPRLDNQQSLSRANGSLIDILQGRREWREVGVLKSLLWCDHEKLFPSPIAGAGWGAAGCAVAFPNAQ